MSTPVDRMKISMFNARNYSLSQDGIFELEITVSVSFPNYDVPDVKSAICLFCGMIGILIVFMRCTVCFPFAFLLCMQMVYIEQRMNFIFLGERKTVYIICFSERNSNLWFCAMVV